MSDKVFVLDTNVLLTDPESIYSFEENDVIVPMKVLDELDDKKGGQNSAGVNARRVIRYLDNLRQQGSLRDGVKLREQSEGKLYVFNNNTKEYIPNDLDRNDPDNKIVSSVLWAQDFFESKKVKIVSRDINLRIKADSLGIDSEDYSNIQVVREPDSIYSGIADVSLPKHEVDEFYRDDEYALEDDQIEQEVYPNQFLIMSSGGLARYRGQDQPLDKVYYSTDQSVWKIKPRNMEQAFAAELLMDEDVPIVTLTGQAGTGKSLLATCAGLKQTLAPSAPHETSSRYERMVIMRPTEPMGRDLGYLPGEMNEKLYPWMEPIRDNLEQLVGDRYYLESHIESGMIDIQALTYVRGRSIDNSYIILDEAQNLTKHEIKTVLTRVGENSKIVLTGDIRQIDSSYIDEVSNGLTYAIEKLKRERISGHITLQQGERSEVASIAAEVL